jgi:MFS family permease
MSGPARLGWWRRRDFRIAWSAGFVNDTGDWVLAIALPVYVFVETRSGTTTALLFVCQLLTAAACGPIGGSIVDRVDLRRCLIATNVAQAVSLLPLIAVTADRVWPAYLVVIAQAALTQLNNPANTALLPRVVEDDELTKANSALAASASLARLAGAPLGGVLVAWGGLEPVVAIDMVSFLLVAVAVTFLRTDTRPLPDPTRSRSVAPHAVLAVLRSAPPLGRLISLSGFVQVAQGGFVVLFVAFVVETLGDDGSLLGLIRGTMAIGALAGAVVIGRAATHVDPLRLYAVGLLGMGVVSLLFWNAPHVTTAPAMYMGLFALSGIPGAAMTVGLVTTIQTRAPRHALGSVAGCEGTASAIGTAVGAITTGLLIDRSDLGPLLNAQAAVYVVGGVAALVLFAPTRPRRTATGPDVKQTLLPQ